MSYWSAIGWAASIVGLALWGFGYFAAETNSFIAWHVVAPAWIADYLPTLEAEAGFLLMIIGSIPLCLEAYQQRA